MIDACHPSWLKDHFGEDHARTLAAANNLAVSYRLVGDCFTARRTDQETLARRQAVLGPAHPYTLFSAANRPVTSVKPGPSGIRPSCCARPGTRTALSSVTT